MSRRSAASRWPQARHFTDLGQLDVLEQCADGRELGPRERPECRQIGNTKPSFQLPLAGEAVEVRCRNGRCRSTRDLDPLAEVRVAEESVRGHDLAGGEAYDLAGKVDSRDLTYLELAGGDVDRGKSDGYFAAEVGPLNTAVR